MDEFINFLKNPSLWGAIFVIYLVWKFQRDIRRELKEERQDLKEEFSSLQTEMASIHKEFKFINIRLSRVEGSFYGRDIYKQEKEGF